MTLIRTSFLSGISTLVKIGALLIVNKVFAVLVGPEGLVEIGNVQNIVQIFMMLSGGALSVGVTKYIAEHYEEESLQQATLSTAIFVVQFLSLVLLVVALLTYPVVSSLIHLKELGISASVLLALSMYFSSLNAILIAALNGKKQVKEFVLSNIIGSLLSLVVVAVLTYLYQTQGALISVLFMQATGLIPTLIFVRKRKFYKIFSRMSEFDFKISKKLLNFVIMTLVATVSASLLLIVIRSHLVAALGVHNAGYWEAMWRVSSAYLMVITSSLSLYYLPKLSELKTKKEEITEIKNTLKIVFPAVVVFGVIIYFLRDLIIHILLSASFSEMRVLFGWQTVGDIFKIVSWVIAYIMWAKGLTRLFIFSEIIASIMFYVLVRFFVQKMGLEGVAVAHAWNYFLYLVLVGLLLRHFYFRKSNI